MPKPLRSEDPKPQSVQFSHFGVLNDGSRSKGAIVTSVVTNGVVLLLLLILGSVVKNAIAPKKEVVVLNVPIEQKPPEVKPPPPPPPVKLPPPPITPPKIKMPDPVPPPPELKPIEVPQPKPVVPAPAPPKKVTPPPAPVKVDLGTHAAAVPNHDAHPTAVRLGATDNPLKPLTGPAVANVNLGSRGVPGMSSANTGNGPHATAVQLGNGCPNCQNLNGTDRGNARVQGVNLGVRGGTGPMNSRNYTNAPVQVQLQTQQPQNVSHPQVQSTVVASAPVVTYKPQPIYTAEAKSMHLEGNVSVKIRVETNGSVDVLGVVHGLGHGLDESAETACRGTRFKPALDAGGRPVPWEGVVLVRFQLS